MNSTKKQFRKQLTEKEVDNIVESQADDDSAWEKPIQVSRAKTASLSIPAELAVRAAFLAKLHREQNVEDWLTKVIKERIELEEVAFNEAKKRDVAEKRRLTIASTRARRASFLWFLECFAPRPVMQSVRHLLNVAKCQEKYDNKRH